eukprot:gnl/MRDRNA2_/MRDRNA2_76373_c0_seq2.p1 gnl/MRDRNA2_/MRDRNA2_76373_c0~~gnl/MRDRNA2_/MRDRNA2_76373_c0_seq2.p1  ORF type:complete len:233 (+),score=26.59 gnl/MRDRNA2_/MRDRNA2_76373_c0_seq2:3-701(+)
MAFAMITSSLALANAVILSTVQKLKTANHTEDVNVLWILVNKTCARISYLHTDLFIKLKALRHGIAHIMLIGFCFSLRIFVVMRGAVAIGKTHKQSAAFASWAFLWETSLVITCVMILESISLINGACDQLMNSINEVHFHIWSVVKAVDKGSNEGLGSGMTKSSTTEEIESKRLARQITHFSMFRTLNEGTGLGLIIGVRVTPALFRGVMSTALTICIVCWPTITSFFDAK